MNKETQLVMHRKEAVIRRRRRKLFGTAAVAFLMCMAWLAMTQTAFANCIDNEDGTVTDTVTNLTWQKATHGKLAWVGVLRECGAAGMRIPNRSELFSLFSSSCRPMLAVENDFYLAVDRPMGPPGWATVVHGAQPYESAVRISVECYYRCVR